MSKPGFNRKLKPRPNYVSTVISVSLVLLLMGIFTLLTLHSGDLADYFKERINIIIELKKSTTPKDVERLRDQLNEYNQIKEGSIDYVSSDQAAEILSRDFGEDVLLLDMPNPLFDVITFNVYSSYLSKGELDLLKEDLKRKFSSINDVYYQDTLIDTVITNIERISYFVLGLSVILALITLLLIFNSIKLALYSNRFLIKNMEMVGASRFFIKKPFLGTAILHGFISGLIASSLLGACLYLFLSKQPEAGDILNREYVWLTLGGILFFGVLLTLVSTWIVVSSYLRKPVDQLF